MTTLQVWIYENDRPLGLHSSLTLRDAATGQAAGHDVLGQAMDRAVHDVEAGRFFIDSSSALMAAE